MKTKFILHGGFNKEKTDEDTSKFYIEILKDTPEKPKVLLVFFAKDDERIPDAAKELMSEFNRVRSGITFEITEKSTFLQQIKWADIIYLKGGRTIKLIKTLKEFPDFRNLLDRKTVAGESAGANVLGKYFYSPSADEIGEGLGFLPIKIIPHYSEQYRGKLDSVGRDLEKLDLLEYQYKIFNK